MAENKRKNAIDYMGEGKTKLEIAVNYADSLVKYLARCRKPATETYGLCKVERYAPLHLAN